MTDKELIQQAFNALNKMTDLFPDALGGHSQEAEDACNAALVLMADLAARLQKPEKTNQCAETCERAKLCAVCGVSLNQEQKPVAWMYTNTQGKTWIVGSDVAPRVDAVPLYSHCPPPKPMKAHAGIMIWCGNAEITRVFNEGHLERARYPTEVIRTVVHEMLDKFKLLFKSESNK